MPSVVKLDDVRFNLCIAQSLVSRHFTPIGTEFQEFPKKKNCVELFEILGGVRKLPAQSQRLCQYHNESFPKIGLLCKSTFFNIILIISRLKQKL